MAIDNKKLKSCPKITATDATDDGGIRLCWTGVDSAEKYGIRRSLRHSGGDDVIKVVTDMQYTDFDVRRDTTYWYRITALKTLSDGKLSRKVSPVAAQVLSDIPAPTQVKAVMSKKARAEITWKAPEGVTEFIINKRNEFFDQLIPIATVKGEKYIDNGIASGQMNYYSVQSVIGEGEKRRDGNFSKEVSCVFLDIPHILEAKARLFGKAEIRLRIVAGADGYIIERSSDGEKFTEVHRTKKSTDYLVSYKPEKHGAYYYRARAYKITDGKEILSEATDKVKIKTK